MLINKNYPAHARNSAFGFNPKIIEIKETTFLNNAEINKVWKEVAKQCPNFNNQELPYQGNLIEPIAHPGDCQELKLIECLSPKLAQIHKSLNLTPAEEAYNKYHVRNKRGGDGTTIFTTLEGITEPLQKAVKVLNDIAKKVLKKDVDVITLREKAAEESNVFGQTIMPKVQGYHNGQPMGETPTVKLPKLPKSVNWMLLTPEEEKMAPSIADLAEKNPWGK